jgi:matrixin
MRPTTFGRLAAAGALAIGVLGTAAPAFAYCFTYDCDPATGACGDDPGDPNDCPTGKVKLRWPVGCMSFSLQQDASRQISANAFDPIAAAAFAAWTNVDCGGGKPPSIRVSQRERVACDKQEYNQEGGNANILMFRDDAWPYTGASNTLALTTLTFNTDTGDVYDADIEINGTKRLTSGDVDIGNDLLSILTHEAGHFLGIAHTQPELHREATMYATYSEGSVTLRDLDADDRQAICALYPPGESSDSCDATPRHGFSGQCGGGDQKDDDGCRVSAPGAAPGPWPWLALGGLLALGRRRGRGAGRRARP